ncbi:MAG: hypothetical protein EBT78_06175 [Betaproteobacteria bacterium]|nr:hypothetical protein [Betaproteobacteria bacterium]NBT67331.1 hypothetical protein [Betaproteobacteria bacterium]NBY06709.1 hypothetical protein [Betaproteobacteria bacterium]
MVYRILFRLLVPSFATVFLLLGCGMKGPLYIPTEPEAKDRATLPQILTPSLPTNKTP